MALIVKGGHDGVAIFEMAQAVAQHLAAVLTANSVSFYSEPSGSKWRITVSGEAGPRLHKRLTDDKRKFVQVFPNTKETQ